VAEPAPTGNSSGAERDAYMSEDGGRPLRGGAHRDVQAEVCSCFPDRWSPRAFFEEPLRPEVVETLLEAARWAPSCFNEQPWTFHYARTRKGRERVLGLLDQGNRAWAARAPLLLLVSVRRRFHRGGAKNPYSSFDAGAAWMSLALQARHLGLYAHAMAGFDHDRAYGELGLSRDDHRVIAAIAVGRRGQAGRLPEDVRRRERPNGRKPSGEVGVELSPKE